MPKSTFYEWEKAYAKQVPGHQIQVDVKFLSFRQEDGRKIKRYQYTAIDYIVEKFPFRIHTVRTEHTEAILPTRFFELC